jgi:isoleucyl-tRNA synthetase
LWERLLEVRSAVQKALEEKRNEKLIGASVEAKVTLHAGGEIYGILERYKGQLPSIFIVSEVELRHAESADLRVEVAHASGTKCERCWNWSETVGQDSRYPTLDARCIQQVEEGWGHS